VRQRLTPGFALTLLLAGQAAAQVPTDTLPADTVPSENTAPRNAFIKSLLVPGLGHFSIGSEKRGLFYLALQGSSYYMLVKTLGTLADAKDRESHFVGIAADSVEAVMAAGFHWRPWANPAIRSLEDPDLFDAALGGHPDVARARKLVNARKQQRQDWITYTIFFTFISAVDAYVAAHLKEFPADVTAVPAADGGLSLRVDLPLPARGRH